MPSSKSLVASFPDLPSSTHTNLQRILCGLKVFAQSDISVGLGTVKGPVDP